MTYVQKHNEDLRYQEIVFNPDEVGKFMAMWEEQLIRGVKRQWAFGIDHLVRLDNDYRLRVFIGYNRRNENVVAMHFVQSHKDGYIECHPPMWEKTEENEKRYLAKFMWFSLIKFAIKDSKMKWIDFGGGRDDSWREMIRNREEYPNPAYKWMYIPEGVKEYPELQPDLMMIEEGGMRKLVEI